MKTDRVSKITFPKGTNIMVLLEGGSQARGDVYDIENSTLFLENCESSGVTYRRGDIAEIPAESIIAVFRSKSATDKRIAAFRETPTT